MQKVNDMLKRFNVEPIALGLRESLRVKTAKVTWATYMMLQAFVKVADTTSRTLAIVQTYRHMTQTWRLELEDLPALLMKKVQPLVADA